MGRVEGPRGGDRSRSRSPKPPSRSCLDICDEVWSADTVEKLLSKAEGPNVVRDDRAAVGLVALRKLLLLGEVDISDQRYQRLKRAVLSGMPANECSLSRWALYAKAIITFEDADDFVLSRVVAELADKLPALSLSELEAWIRLLHRAKGFLPESPALASFFTLASREVLQRLEDSRSKG